MLTWYTQYKDGTRHDYVAQQFTVAQIETDKVDTFVVHDPNKPTPVLVIHFDDERKRPIYVRRVEKPGRYPFTTICHIVGWQMKVGGENVQSISYVFETQDRIVEMEQETPEGKIEKVPFRQELVWVENAGKFTQERNNGWFKDPGEKHLNMIGSKSK